MSYYSDVAIAMKETDYEEMIARLEYINDLNESQKSFINDYPTIHRGDEVVVLSYDFVKWYEDFKEVQYIMDYLVELHEKGKPYKFVRMGEETSDIEIKESYGENGDDSCNIITPEVYTEISIDI